MKHNVLEERILNKMYMVVVEKIFIQMILIFAWLGFIMGLFLILEGNSKLLLLASKVISKPSLKMEFNHRIKASILEGSKF